MTDVTNLKWRVIGLQERSAFENMALDESVCESITAGVQPPTIRFYGWKPSAVSIGYFQSIEREVNLDVCKNAGVDVVRRRTGGGAVYHDTAGEITYSVLAPETLFPKNIIESYKEICGWLIAGLAGVGLQAEFKPINDIIAGGKKISGNAQTRRGGILQQHGTVLYDLDVRKMFSLLNVSQEKISDKFIAAVEDRVTGVTKLCGASKQETYNALYKAFTDGKNWGEGDYSQEELERAQALATEKYCSREWNFMR